ncbi:hypothetical protein V6N12_048116 [Hibiscus sabdariffa]|uniref:F-box associated domain-containing protein n=1 Tax=Hibiscus sabdariffa TaxID=183260 RepID=A0ABR2B572_9ROSI
MFTRDWENGELHELWVMEYGVAESWAKISVPHNEPDKMVGDRLDKMTLVEVPMILNASTTEVSFQILDLEKRKKAEKSKLTNPLEPDEFADMGRKNEISRFFSFTKLVL